MLPPLLPVSILVMPSTVMLFELGRCPFAVRPAARGRRRVPCSGVRQDAGHETREAEEATAVDGDVLDGGAFQCVRTLAARRLQSADPRYDGHALLHVADLHGGMPAENLSFAFTTARVLSMVLKPVRKTLRCRCRADVGETKLPAWSVAVARCPLGVAGQRHRRSGETCPLGVPDGTEYGSAGGLGLDGNGTRQPEGAARSEGGGSDSIFARHTPPLRSVLGQGRPATRKAEDEARATEAEGVAVLEQSRPLEAQLAEVRAVLAPKVLEGEDPAAPDDARVTA